MWGLHNGENTSIPMEALVMFVTWLPNFPFVITVNQIIEVIDCIAGFCSLNDN